MSRKIVGVTVGTSMDPKKIAEKIQTGTSLPMVNEEDEGKILQVEGGKWVAESLPTYDGELVVTHLANNTQKLQTAGKYTASDIMVDKIPYSETTTSNTEGKTVSIG